MTIERKPPPAIHLLHPSGRALHSYSLISDKIVQPFRSHSSNRTSSATFCHCLYFSRPFFAHSCSNQKHNSKSSKTGTQNGYECVSKVRQWVYRRSLNRIFNSLHTRNRVQLIGCCTTEYSVRKNYGYNGDFIT